MTMKTHFPTLLMILLGVQLNAQPVLNFVDVGTVPGDAFAYHDCPWQTPGTPGMAQTWDLSGLTTDSVIQISFVDPATTPDAASFPLATIAADNDSGYAYSAFGATGGQFLGISLTGLATIVYTDPMQMVVYPATYLTTWTDAFAANFSIGGFPIARTGTVTAEVDGYGTLVMPYGTLTDVLRATYVEEHTDDNGFGATTLHHEYTYFLQAGTHYPIVDIYTITVTPAFGPPTTVQGTHWLVVDPQSAVPSAQDPFAFTTYPNPVTDQLNVVLSQAEGASTLDLIDASGRLVEHRVLGNVSMAARLERFDLRGTQPGIYLLRATVNGLSVLRRLIVE
jgi:hypothetical protein